jgi:hypothetical protein
VKKLKPQEQEPRRCWVNETQKICFDSEEIAQGAARLAEIEHGIRPGDLRAYKCEYGDHWHLAHQ